MGVHLAAEVEFSYTPSGEQLRLFHLSDNFGRVLLGPVGSGKTTSCAVEVYRRACLQEPDSDGIRKSRWLAVRNTVPELLTTTIPSWTGIFSERFGEMSMGSPITHYVRTRLPDKTRVELDVIFMGLDGPDAPDKVRGMELSGAWINEARDVPKPVVDMITTRVGRYPPVRHAGPTWYGVIADTNMCDDRHWIYNMSEVERPANWDFFRQPGGMYMDDGQWVANPAAENVQNLVRNYYYNQIAGKDEDWIRVYIGAEFGFVREGKAVMPEYLDHVHVGDVDPIPDLPLHVGADFGLTPAAVIAQRTATGQIRVLDELTTDGIGAVRFGEQLGQLLRHKYGQYKVFTMTGDPAGNKRSETDERTVFQILAAMNLPFVPAATNVFTLRREAVAVPLTRMIDGKPGMLIDRSCSVLRSGLAGAYHFRRIQVTAERYMEQPEKNMESHVCEALQYLCLGLGEGKNLVTPDKYKSRDGPRVLTRRNSGPRRHKRPRRFNSPGASTGAFS